MDTQPTFTPRDCLTHIIGDIAEALSDRPEEAPHQRAARLRATTDTIRAFQPRDAIEAMLAGHCVMFHEMIVDSVHTSLRGEPDSDTRPTRSGIIAMDKAFGANLDRLERYRSRQAEASPEVQPTGARAETDIADRVQRHQSPPSAQQSPASVPVQTAESVAARLGSLEAVPALEATDPVRFAKAPGEDQPRVVHPAAASASMSGLNGHAVGHSSQAQRPAYAGNRQARRHPGS